MMTTKEHVIKLDNSNFNKIAGQLKDKLDATLDYFKNCLLYTSPSPRD